VSAASLDATGDGQDADEVGAPADVSGLVELRDDEQLVPAEHVEDALAPAVGG
jgi:hypothetical protein